MGKESAGRDVGWVGKGFLLFVVFRFLFIMDSLLVATHFYRTKYRRRELLSLSSVVKVD